MGEFVKAGTSVSPAYPPKIKAKPGIWHHAPKGNPTFRAAIIDPNEHLNRMSERELVTKYGRKQSTRVNG